MNPTKIIILSGFGMVFIGGILLLLNISSLPIRDYTLINVGIGLLVFGGVMVKLCVRMEAVQV